MIICFLNQKPGSLIRTIIYSVLVSYGRAAKEPNRDDFEAGSANTPKAEISERCGGSVSGISNTQNFRRLETVLYVYRNQLALTGKINDVGAYTRTNITVSYRRESNCSQLIFLIYMFGER